jgi:hypothetical protein
MPFSPDPVILVRVVNNSDHDVVLRYNRRTTIVRSGGEAITDFHAARIAFGDPRSDIEEKKITVEGVPYTIPSRSTELERLHTYYGTYYNDMELASKLEGITVSDANEPFTEWVLPIFDPLCQNVYHVESNHAETEFEALRRQVAELQTKISDKTLADLPEDNAFSPRRPGRPPKISMSTAERN